MMLYTTQCLPLMEAEYKKLLRLISSSEKNEEEICEILFRCFQTNPEQTKIMINQPKPQKSGAETLLMWAVWTLKKHVVEKLLAYGADPKYINETMQSVSTYWDCFPTKPDEDVASEIAILLHAHGADLSRSYSGDWSIVRKADEYDLVKLKATLASLGYQTYDFKSQLPKFLGKQ